MQLHTHQKRIICIFLTTLTIAAIIFACFAPAKTADARTLAEVDSDIAECNALLSTLKKERNDIDNQLSSLGSDSKDMEKQMALYTEQREIIQAEIDLITETVEAYGIKKASIEAEIALKEDDKQFALSLYEQIMVYSFKYGSTSNFELLFSSENFSDFMTRLDSARSIMEYSASLIADIEAAQSDLEALEADLDAAGAKLDEYAESQKNAKKALEDATAVLEEKAAALGISLSELTERYQTVNSTIASVNKKISALRDERQDILDSMSDFLFPLAKNSKAFRISSDFGYRKDPFTGKTAYHSGIDIPADKGTPIYAVKSGTVTRSEKTSSAGNVVVVYHGNGLSTLYCHATERLVKVGDTVSRGQTIATVGTTGRSTGYHLHFSVLVNGSYVDPLDYLDESIFVSISK